MKAIDFPQRNIMLGETQTQYQTLPAFVELKNVIVPNRPQDPQLSIMTKNVPVQYITCFELSDEELADVILTKRIWYRQYTCGNNFHPMMIETKSPFLPTELKPGN